MNEDMLDHKDIQLNAGEMFLSPTAYHGILHMAMVQIGGSCVRMILTIRSRSFAAMYKWPKFNDTWIGTLPDHGKAWESNKPY
jgi:hypothetical protein